MTNDAVARRRVRKGTHSCWECRRRKIRCKFASQDDTICAPCRLRGAPCISQEFEQQAASRSSPATAPSDSSSDSLVSQRLQRLEQLLLDKLGDDKRGSTTTSVSPNARPRTGSADAEADRVRPEPPTWHDPSEDPDLFGLSAVRNARGVAYAATSRCPLSMSMITQPIPEPSSPSSTADTSNPLQNPPVRSRHAAISCQLRALFPPLHVLAAVAEKSPGADFVLAAFFSINDKADGKCEPPDVLARVPPADAHPALLGKRLAQLAVCLQQLPPAFDEAQLHLSKPVDEVMAEWIAAVHTLVASRDELLACHEGIECLLFLGFYLSEAGQLRKAWMITRRALSLAQLMGLDRACVVSSSPSAQIMSPLLRSCDPQRKYRPSAAFLWFRINCADRYHSLMLGLAIGSRDSSFATEAAMADDAPLDRLSKLYSVIAGKIAERNDEAAPHSNSTSSHVYGLTQALDLDLDHAARQMNRMWWEVPDVTATACVPRLENEANQHDDGSSIVAASKLKIQVRHYLLMTLVHLPYLLRDGEARRYEYNRVTCMQASRAVLERFLEFRSVFVRVVSGRHVDYSALIAAMTLVLGYLRPQNRGPDKAADMARDRALAVEVRDRLRQMAAENDDRLSSESAETITELLPIVQPQDDGNARNMHLSVPFLGTVNINPHLEVKPNETSTMPLEVQQPEDMSTMPLSVDCGSQQGDFTGMDWNPMDMGGMVCDDFEASTMQGVDLTYWSMVNNWSPWCTK